MGQGQGARRRLGKWVELGLPVEAKGSRDSESRAGSAWLRRASESTSESTED